MDILPFTTTTPPPTTTANSNSNKKSVSFSDEGGSIEIAYMSLSDYSQSEYNNCFYDCLDYQDFKLDAKRTARLIDQRKRKQQRKQHQHRIKKGNDESISKDKKTSSQLIKDGNDYDDDDNDDNDNDIMICVRGCEHLTEDGSYHRYGTKAAGISSVLKHYHPNIIFGACSIIINEDEDGDDKKNQKIANEYSKAVQDCVLSAYKIGLEDERVVKEMDHHHHHQERRQPKKQMSILRRIRVVPSLLFKKKKPRT